MAKVSNYSYFNKWTTPIWYSKDPDYNSLREDAISECLKFHVNKNRTQVAHGIKANLYESEFDFFQKAKNRKYNSIARIEEYIKKQFTYCFLDYFQRGHYPEDVSYMMNGVEEKDLNVNLKESWVHIANGKGSWHGNHRHPMTSWGAIYYLKVDGVNDNNGGKNTINQPVDNQYIDFGNFFEHEYAVWSPPIENGGCLFFPAHLSHNAQPYFGKEDRIVIATNIIVGKNV